MAFPVDLVQDCSYKTIVRTGTPGWTPIIVDISQGQNLVAALQVILTRRNATQGLTLL